MNEKKGEEMLFSTAKRTEKMEVCYGLNQVASKRVPVLVNLLATGLEPGTDYMSSSCALKKTR